MSVLSEEQLFAPTLPERWGRVLEALADIDDLRSGPSLTKDDRRAEAHAIYRRLLDETDDLVEETPPDCSHESPGFRRWFSEAVLLWSRFAETGSAPLIDTVGTPTLQEFPLDLPLDAEASASVRAALRKAFDWSDAEFEQVEARVEHLTSNLDLKRRITKALAEHVDAQGLASPEGRLDLMKAFYGDVPFRPGDVDLVLASTAVFFFVPRRGSRLETPDWKERSDAEKKKVRDFFEKVDVANTAETKRFPSFGLYEAEAMSGALVGELARATGVKDAVVKDTLATMFSVIPTRLRAQYLVHDLWGHTWQEALNEFEWEYALLPKIDDPLEPTTGPELGGADAPTLGSCFVERGGRTELDEERLMRFAEADLRGRIQIAVSVPLSEILADFMESKFSRAKPDLELPTSSLIPSTSLKLDLSVADARVQVVRYTKPYRALAVDPDDRARLARALEATGLPKQGLEDAVVRAGRAMWMAFEPAFDETLRPEPSPATEGRPRAIKASVYRRVLLQFTLIMVALERSLDWTQPGDQRWRNPASCPDLFAIALTHFYEQARQSNFWRIHQVARTEFRPGCERLRAALSG